MEFPKNPMLVEEKTESLDQQKRTIFSHEDLQFVRQPYSIDNCNRLPELKTPKAMVEVTF